MNPATAFRNGFIDELEKISFAIENRKGWNVVQSRSCKRPMSVETLLRKERDGTLGGYKLAYMLRHIVKLAETHSVVPYPLGVEGDQVRRPKRPGDIPCRDEMEVVNPKREDGRESAFTFYPPGTHLTDVGAVQQPPERYY